MTIAPAIVSVISVIKGAVTALNAVLMANPIILIITLIVALVGALVYAYNHCETFRNIVNSVFEKVKEVVGGVVSALVTFFTETIPNAFQFLKDKISPILETIKTVFETIWNGIVTVVSTCINTVKTVITTVINVIKTVITTVWNAIKTVTTTVWNAIKTVIINPIKSAWETVKSVIDKIKNTITTVWNASKTVTTTVWNGIKNAIIDPIKSAWETVKGVIDNIREKVKNIFEGIVPRLNISLPHISVHGGKAPFGIGGQGSLPSFNVSWNKLGDIFSKPTIFATDLGFQGVGEAGPEAVAPIDVLQKYVAEAVDNRNLNLERKLDQVIGLMANYYPDALRAMDRPVVVGVDSVDSALSDKNNKVSRGW